MNKQEPRETWRDWWPDGVPEPPALITRAELLAKIEENSGIRVTERELRYWEMLGALPGPIRQYHAGAIHATYPFWHAEVVALVPELRARRLPWPAIRDRLRARFAERVGATGSIKLSEIVRGVEHEPLPPRPPMSTDLVMAIQTFIHDMNRDHQAGIAVAELCLWGADGKARARYGIPAPGDRQRR